MVGSSRLLGLLRSCRSRSSGRRRGLSFLLLQPPLLLLLPLPFLLLLLLLALLLLPSRYLLPSRCRHGPASGRQRRCLGFGSSLGGSGLFSSCSVLRSNRSPGDGGGEACTGEIRQRKVGKQAKLLAPEPAPGAILGSIGSQPPLNVLAGKASRNTSRERYQRQAVPPHTAHLTALQPLAPPVPEPELPPPPFRLQWRWPRRRLPPPAAR